MSRKQKMIVLIAIAVVIGLGAAVQAIYLSSTITHAPVVSVVRNADEMTAAFSAIKPAATQDEVLGSMGSVFAVSKCPADASSPPDSSKGCAHVWHYEAGDQAWEFMFDMDGNLMKKNIATPGQ